MVQAQAVTGDKPVVANPFADSDSQFDALKLRLQSAEVAQMDHSDLEKLIDAEGRELLRRLLQDHLSLRARQEQEHGRTAPVVGDDDDARTHQRPTERGLMSIFGPVTVSRIAHGARGKTGLRPLDAELNLPPDLYSLGVRRRAAEAASKVSFDESVSEIRTTTGAAISKRQLEEVVQRAAWDFDAFYAMREALAAKAIAETSGLLVISTDAKGVVMRTADLREATRKAAQRRRHKLKRRLSKGEKRNAKRMAQVAAVYTVAPFPRTAEDIVREFAPVREVVPDRPRPEQKRVWASVSEEPEVVIRQAFEEALRRDPDRRKTWVALSDGNETQLRLLKKLAREYSVAVTIVLDVIHVLEYLWKAAFVFHKDGTPEAEAWVSERLLQMLRGKASNVAAGIRRSATLRQLSTDQRRPADKCADYVLKYAPYLHYDMYLDKGLPIATGVIEGACRYLVKDRMDITGARWGLKGAEAVLRLRSLRASGDFDEYWAFHEAREWERNHAARYADGRIPPLRKPTYKRRGDRSHLRAVK